MMNRSFSLATIAVATILLVGCAVGKSEQPAMYDLGPLPAQQAGTLPALPPVGIAEIHAPAWLDATQFYYRLNYANSQQPHPYAYARWTMPPAQLLLQRLKARIAQADGVALAASDGATNVPVLRIEVDDFTHHFAAPRQSHAQLALRASVFRGRTLVAHRSFTQQVPASSGNAAGGAQALAAASDAAIAGMVAWLGALDLK
jgi:cholesterol transport system auxiliary component